MADDSEWVCDNMKYHPCDTPRGMKYYKKDLLTDEQQVELNELKIDTVREDEQYLAAHPEIRAIVSLIVRNVLLNRPLIGAHELIANYFSKSEWDIRKDIDRYLSLREDHKYEDTEAIKISRRYKPQPKEQLVRETSSSFRRPADFKCFKECVCPKAMENKSQIYIRYDESNWSNTELWLNNSNVLFPKMSRQKSDPEALTIKEKMGEKKLTSAVPVSVGEVTETMDRETGNAKSKAKSVSYGSEIVSVAKSIDKGENDTLAEYEMLNAEDEITEDEIDADILPNDETG